MPVSDSIASLHGEGEHSDGLSCMPCLSHLPLSGSSAALAKEEMATEKATAADFMRVTVAAAVARDGEGTQR